MENTPSLSRGQVHRALNSFVATSGLWGAWGQTCGLGTAAFTGFALHLGTDGSFIRPLHLRRLLPGPDPTAGAAFERPHP